MIYYFTPYNKEKKFLGAISDYMNLLAPDDWAVIMDGDTMFLTPNFGTLIENHIKTSPDTKISKAILSREIKILLMEDIYLLHYCRL